MNSEDELRARLSALPTPPMPDDVAAAIAQRLADEPRPGAQDQTVVAITPRHQRRLSGLLVAAAVAGVAMLLAVTAKPPAAPVAGGPPVIRAGAIYEPGDFAREVRERFLGAPAATGPTNTFADTAEGIAGCTDAVDAFGHVLAVDAGSYDDTAAVVLVTSYPANTQYEEIWVVDPGCGPADPGVIRHMVYDVDNSTATL